MHLFPATSILQKEGILAFWFAIFITATYLFSDKLFIEHVVLQNYKPPPDSGV
jgi:hypothetical protein